MRARMQGQVREHGARAVQRRQLARLAADLDLEAAEHPDPQRADPGSHTERLPAP
jgi:hypothetical protein